MLVIACTGDDPSFSNAGTYQQACKTDGTCDGDLVCTQGVCLHVGETPEAGASSSGASSGAASSGASSGATSSSGASSGTTSSGGSSGASSSGDSGNPYPDCRSPQQGVAAPRCNGTQCSSAGSEKCCYGGTAATCTSQISVNCGGVYLECDGPASCNQQTCCLGNEVSIVSGTKCEKKAVYTSSSTTALHTACTSACTGPQYVVCSKTGDPCPNAKTCTTIEVAIPFVTNTFLLDVRL